MQFLSVPLRKKRCQVNRHTVLILEILKHEKKRCQNWEGASWRGDWSPGESSGPSSGGGRAAATRPRKPSVGLGARLDAGQLPTQPWVAAAGLAPWSSECFTPEATLHCSLKPHAAWREESQALSRPRPQDPSCERKTGKKVSPKSSCRLERRGAGGAASWNPPAPPPRSCLQRQLHLGSQGHRPRAKDSTEPRPGRGLCRSP